MQNRPRVSIKNVGISGNWQTGISVPDTIDLSIESSEIHGAGIGAAIEVRDSGRLFVALGLPPSVSCTDFVEVLDVLRASRNKSVGEKRSMLAKTPLWEKLLSAGANVAKIADTFMRLSQDAHLMDRIRGMF
jgi:hypothetical protein